MREQRQRAEQVRRPMTPFCLPENPPSPVGRHGKSHKHAPQARNPHPNPSLLGRENFLLGDKNDAFPEINYGPISRCFPEMHKGKGIKMQLLQR